MFESFFITGVVPPNAEGGSYTPLLVAASYVIAVLGSYVGLTMATYLFDAPTKKEKTLLHWGGAFALGSGIWSMHFVGMLAFKMRMFVTYDALLTALSMLIAVIIAYGVLQVTHVAKLSAGRLAISAILLGLGICAMHYTGMAAMRMDGDLRYAPSLFFLSVAIAITASGAALWMVFHLGRYNNRWRFALRMMAALVMGAAICGMHYTGMRASIFIPFAQCRYDPGQSFDMLAFAVTAITSILLGMALALGIYSREQRVREEEKYAFPLGMVILSKLSTLMVLLWMGSNSFYIHHLLARHNTISPPQLISLANNVYYTLYFGVGILTLLCVTWYFAIRSVRCWYGKLEITRRASQQANDAKSEFLANMSHEIRTPLNSMIGTAELVLETEMTAQQENHIRTILNSSENLLEIINDILDLSKIESGKLELAPTPFDLEMAIEETVELFAPKVREKERQMELLVHFVSGTPRHVIGDPVRVRQILSNLLSNAIKFTDSGYIMITVEAMYDDAVAAGKNRIRISVRDTGIGIQADKLQIIFDKFSQADASTTRKFGGSGLGLSICRQLARMMEGDVMAESTPGVGSIFSVTMVLERDPAACERATQEHLALRGKKALIVDDLKPGCDIMTAQLARAGIESASAPDAKTALKMLADAKTSKTPFDLLISDYVLSEMASTVFTHQAKALWPEIVVVMVTALAEKGYAQIFASAGCDAYLTKPIRPRQLFDLLTKIFEAKRSGKSLTMLTPLNTFHKGAMTIGNDDTRFLDGAEILLAEDNRANRELVVKLLENFYCRATTVESGEEAVDIVRRRPFDLILMDCQMPEMDGFEASSIIHGMKKRGEIADVPIIALTANAMKGDREKCLESGMNDYLTKPLRKTKLYNVLMQWLPPKGKRAADRHAHPDAA